MTRINLKHDRTKVVPMNTATYTVYISLLSLIAFVTVFSILALGLYTLHLINTTPFYSIIAN